MSTSAATVPVQGDRGLPCYDRTPHGPHEWTTPLDPNDVLWCDGWEQVPDA